MRLFLIMGLFSLTLPALAQESVSFRNDREGQSFYYNANKINRALRDFQPEEIVEAYHDSIKGVEASKVCAYDVNNSLKSALLKKSPRFDEYEGALLFLRHWNEIDDVALKILLDAEDVVNAPIDPKDPQSLRRPLRKNLPDMLKAVGQFKEKYLKSSCYDDAYKSLVSDLRKIADVSDAQLEGLFVEASRKRVITGDVYQMLERARAQEITGKPLTLKSYYQKHRSLRLHKPLRDPNEQSEFITEKAHKTKVSRRIQLMENYSDLQIMLMADVIKRLRTRLEAKNVTINIEGADESIEIITLEPMERFRLAIKLLRKEMILLSTNTYFNGRTPGYFDLIAASYETGLIPASELKELGGLEEIWNPKKTFWEKAAVWVRTFSSVATIAIPQPYGFIPALVLVVIEATVGKGSDNQTDDTVLF